MSRTGSEGDAAVAANPGSTFAAAAAKAQAYADAALADATKRAYGRDWRAFSAWCAEHGLTGLPAAPGTVALYLADAADRLRAATIDRRLAAISHAHAVAGLPSPRQSPAVARVRRGIRVTHGTAPARKAAVRIGDLRRMLEALPCDARGRRDRALLLLGFAGGFRRSELAAVEIADLAFSRDGMLVRVRRGKTDAEGGGRTVPIRFGREPATCPVTAVIGWLYHSGIRHGPLFRGVGNDGTIAARALSDRSVALVVKRAALGAGLDPRRYAGHSLRRGLATAATEHGAPPRVAMRQMGHRDGRAFAGYVEEAGGFVDDVGRYLPL